MNTLTQLGREKIVDAIEEEIQKTRELIEAHQSELSVLENVRNLMKGQYGLETNTRPINGQPVDTLQRVKRSYTRKTPKPNRRNNNKNSKRLDWMNPAIEILKEKQEFIPVKTLVDMILSRNKSAFKKIITRSGNSVKEFTSKAINNFRNNSTGLKSKMMKYDDGDFSNYLGLTEWRDNKENYLRKPVKE